MGFLKDLADKAFGGGSSVGPTAPEEKQLETANEQPLEDLKLAAYVKSKVEEVRSSASRIAHEGVWMTNIAYALGFDSVYYDTTSRQYKPVGGPFRTPTRNRVHANQILPAMQNRLARMCKNPPKWEVRPEGQELDAKEKASLAYDVLLDIWERLHLNEKRIDLGMWLQQCGHGFLVASFDEELGEPMVDPTTGEFISFEGDLRAEVASAFEFFFDPKATEIEQAKWAVRAKVRDLQYFRDHYPERGFAVKEEGAWLLSTQYELRINSLNNTGPNTSGVQDSMKNAAIELAYYEKRSQKHPNGRLVIVANGVVLKNDELPIGEFPFVKFDDIKVAGKFYSEAAVTHARPLQDQYNRNLARTSDWVNKLLAGKYLAAKGHGLSQEALNDRSGEVVEYNNVPGTPPPSAMTLPVIPQYAYQERIDIKKELFDVFGLSEVSRGQLPSAGIPAVGMQLLIEQDETRIGIEVEQHEHAWARFGTILLKYANKFIKNQRTIKKKVNSEYQFLSYSGSDLPSNPDVQVVRGSTIPTSKSLRRQEILNAYGQGLLGNPQDPAIREKVLGMLEYGDVTDVWKDYRLDKQRAAKEIRTVEEGSIPEVNKLDNHAISALELNRYRKSDKFESLSPEQKSLVDFLIDLHAELATEMSNPALKQQLDNVQNGLFSDGTDPNDIMVSKMKAEQISQMALQGVDAAHDVVNPQMAAPQPPPPMAGVQ